MKMPDANAMFRSVAAEFAMAKNWADDIARGRGDCMPDSHRDPRGEKGAFEGWAWQADRIRFLTDGAGGGSETIPPVTQDMKAWEEAARRCAAGMPAHCASYEVDAMTASGSWFDDQNAGINHASPPVRWADYERPALKRFLVFEAVSVIGAVGVVASLEVVPSLAVKAHAGLAELLYGGGAVNAGAGAAGGLAATQAAVQAARTSAAARAGDFVLKAKHAAGARGTWAKFAEGVNPNEVLREALSVPGARILPNDANSFRVVADLGRVIGHV